MGETSRALEDLSKRQTGSGEAEAGAFVMAGGGDVRKLSSHFGGAETLGGAPAESRRPGLRRRGAGADRGGVPGPWGVYNFGDSGLAGRRKPIGERLSAHVGFVGQTADSPG